ncbi:hypothetical protein F1C58_10250 [Glaciihabitans sp. INWT7]|uniref:DUF6993 domain-containing protein n=1 Tax=Glaciihabitans sp. INWT7 TaxID=2596912 RepID=UPI00162A4434|nr:hypothetical protein [Glaciihabitans sp. INWT7]QNE47241.1 hypothetical protein F1C58_10250 [Glaciihabitans sp. INWT7]
MSARGRMLLAAPLLLLAVTLAGCSPAASAPTAVPASASASASPGRTATPAPTPSYRPDGTAQANKAWFDAVNTKLFASNGGANGRAIIDSLVSAGFDKAAMQVTPDKTSINGGVDSILFSVKIGDSCLLGQHGGGGYSSAVEKALSSGLCLIGKTRTIDW